MPLYLEETQEKSHTNKMTLGSGSFSSWFEENCGGMCRPPTKQILKLSYRTLVAPILLKCVPHVCKNGHFRIKVSNLFFLECFRHAQGNMKEKLIQVCSNLQAITLMVCYCKGPYKPSIYIGLFCSIISMTYHCPKKKNESVTLMWMLHLGELCSLSSSSIGKCSFRWFIPLWWKNYHQSIYRMKASKYK